MKEKTFTKGSSRIAFIVSLFIMLAAFAMLMPLKAHAADIAVGTFDNIDWRITESGTLELGKTGETQTLTAKTISRGANGTDPWPWLEHKAVVNRVDVRGEIQLKSNIAFMFDGMREIAQFSDISNIKTDEATQMAYMFRGCKKLTSLDLKSFKTEKVASFDSMFDGCEALTSLDISSFNTEKSTNMWAMFRGCQNLKSLDITHFKTDKVTRMSGMFADCYSLEGIDLSKLNTSSCSSLYGMFSGCKALKTIDLSTIDTSPASSLAGMFNDCKSLTNIEIPDGFVHSGITDVKDMFKGTYLESIDVSNFDTSGAANMSGMFANNPYLTEVKGLDKLNTSNAENMSNMFKDCTKLEQDAMLELNMDKVDDAKGMFANANALRDTLKKQMGAEYMDFFPAELKEKVKEAVDKIDAVFAEGSEATADDIKAMIASAKTAIAAADIAIPAAADAAKTAAEAALKKAQDEAAKDPKSEEAKKAADAAEEAAKTAEGLAEASKSITDEAVRKAEQAGDSVATELAKMKQAEAAKKVEEAKKISAAVKEVVKQVNNPSVTTPPTVEEPKVGEQFVVADNTYEVLTVPASGNCSATLVKANNAKTVVVPDTVAYKNRTFEVNEINTKAFYKNTKKVTLGANVDTIDKQAFKGSKVKTVILKTKDLTKKGVKGSLKGSKVTTVKVKVGAKKANQKFVKKYKKIFTKKIAGKKVTVK